jgi:tRNA(fMet)-specific endonuclease VapC
MTYLLDTNTCIRYLNGRSENIRQHLEATQPQNIVLCSVVKADKRQFLNSFPNTHIAVEFKSTR